MPEVWLMAFEHLGLVTLGMEHKNVNSTLAGVAAKAIFIHNVTKLLSRIIPMLRGSYFFTGWNAGSDSNVSLLSLHSICFCVFKGSVLSFPFCGKKGPFSGCASQPHNRGISQDKKRSRKQGWKTYPENWFHPFPHFSGTRGFPTIPNP